MKVTLKDIDRENFRAAVKLEVNEDQKNFVAPNVFSIAQSKVEPAFNVQASTTARRWSASSCTAGTRRRAATASRV